MVLLRENFRHLHCIGLWPSINWPSHSWKSRIYWLYTIFVLTMTYWFGITESGGLLTMSESIEDFSDNCFMLLTTIVVCVKIDTIRSKRAEFLLIINALETHPHKPTNPDEEKIHEVFTNRARLIYFVFGIVTETSVLIMTVSVFFQGIPYGDLPYKAWIPYNYSKPVMYWFTYCQQLLVVIFLANVGISVDTTLAGLFILICAQFNILKYRLEKAIDQFDNRRIMESKTPISRTVEMYERQIIDCIKYHRAIFEIAEDINSLFKRMIFIQYSASTIIICLTTFMISQVSILSTKSLFMVLYLVCILAQIFLFCAAADAVTVECESVTIAVCSAQWYAVTYRARDYLLLMMVRTLRPVVFMSGHLFIFSLDSFSNILKRSYSAYTMLKQNTN